MTEENKVTGNAMLPKPTMEAKAINLGVIKENIRPFFYIASIFTLTICFISFFAEGLVWAAQGMIVNLVFFSIVPFMFWLAKRSWGAKLLKRLGAGKDW